jgi:hypothetical protein
LKSLSTLLRERYDVRDKIIARGYADTNLLKAEVEIIRVQKIITSPSPPLFLLQATRDLCDGRRDTITTSSK